MATHSSHLSRILGTEKRLFDISKLVLQEYIDKRSKESGRYERNVSVQTIKKELRTFSTVWNWAKEGSLVEGVFPNKKLRYPKYEEKPPFQTIGQIRSKITRFNLSDIKSRSTNIWALPCWTPASGIGQRSDCANGTIAISGCQDRSHRTTRRPAAIVSPSCVSLASMRSS